PTTDSIIIQQDDYKPIASADASGFIRPNQSVTLIGGDATASNYITPFGGSQGLTWKWTGPSGFLSTLQNPQTSTPGTYYLTLTEARNGCAASAQITVLAEQSPLPVRFIDFTVSSNKQEKTNKLAWRIANASDSNYFAIEKSFDGSSFTTLGYMFGSTSEDYQYKDAASDRIVYYRIKAVNKVNVASYSPIMKVDNSAKTTEKIKAYTDEAKNIIVDYTADKSESITIRLMNINGQLMNIINKNVGAGRNTFKLTDFVKPGEGIYLLNIQSGQKGTSIKIKM
ncbi:MAG: T9SS type A sorting domain-containing protein, partial [Chitinophagaceae bacterium]|nr:T9SS type A sorting domain-containing protein [Chitinophagaceae bacterium]